MRSILHGAYVDSGVAVILSETTDIIISHCVFRGDGGRWKDSALKMTLANRFWKQLKLMGEVEGIFEPDSKYMRLVIDSVDEEDGKKC